MVHAPVPVDRLTPVLIALTGYYVVAGFASLTNVAVAVWVMSLIYCAPILSMAAALAWIGTRSVLARRGGARRPLPA